MANAIRSVNRRHRHRRRCGRVLIAALVAGGSLVASAHPEWSPIRVNRYAKLIVSEPGQLRLVYTLLYGEGPALPARKGADLDANGRIDERERALLGAQAQAQVAAGLHLTLDGEPLRLPAPKIDVGMAGDAVAPEPFSIDLAYVVEAPTGAHTLVLDDRVEVPNEGDTEVSIDEPGAARLIAAYQGRAPGPQPVVRVFTFRGPRYSLLEDRSVKLRWQSAERIAPTAAARWLRPAAIAALVLLLTGLVLWRVRRRG
jgi:hypothetical protein